MIRRAAAGAGAWLLALTLAACMATAPSKAPETPASQPGGGGAAAPGLDGEAAEAEEDAATPVVSDDLATLDAQVDQAWAELRALDEAREKAGAAAPGEAAARCDRIRGLADEICTLSDRMCSLATEHPGEPRYADACARSGETCRDARRAAERCPAV